MDARARDAADQLMLLTRLLLRADGVPPGVAAPRTRVLRHNRAELTAAEQHVFGLLVAGRRTARLAALLEISERAVEDHLRALLGDFALPEAPVPAPPDVRRARRRRGMLALFAAPGATALIVAGGAAAFALQVPEAEAPRPVRTGPLPDGTRSAAAAGYRPARPYASHRVSHGTSPRASYRAGRGARLPRGVATATSFWDAATARGARMSARTVASPYWPLGTRVRVSYRGRSAVGVVQDFGPAAWAVAQHAPPAIIDLSEPMMAALTGRRVHAVPVRFEVLAFGAGPVYRTSGPGHDLAFRR
ncbi:LuxR family transcriptional regulatory, chaperone HchA-associated [Actinomadura rubteroloni]|uniref:LuxR family transcriptional regulatory, chaperone HchA-associated n=1 Tax=Actinomadura rubteroloni TaxID=1926885 RepID=A0A2P4UBJ4_9ACTN|nr:RlpA-like double-psi beta-barrel domain-containing protein [Actinomadura rubteroloni]POM22416.1 LuxR family transcriptional regulatory, chaperone HchA-associated [Actinomadura rubteroloni]